MTHQFTTYSNDGNSNTCSVFFALQMRLTLMKNQTSFQIGCIFISWLHTNTCVYIIKHVSHIRKEHTQK